LITTPQRGTSRSATGHCRGLKLPHVYPYAKFNRTTSFGCPSARQLAEICAVHHDTVNDFVKLNGVLKINTPPQLCIRAMPRSSAQPRTSAPLRDNSQRYVAFRTGLRAFSLQNMENQKLEIPARAPSIYARYAKVKRMTSDRRHSLRQLAEICGVSKEMAGVFAEKKGVPIIGTPLCQHQSHDLGRTPHCATTHRDMLRFQSKCHLFQRGNRGVQIAHPPPRERHHRRGDGLL